MFLPPEQRQPGLPPWNPPPPKRQLTPREEAILPWVIGFIVLTIFLAPIGGSTLIDALWYLLSAARKL